MDIEGGEYQSLISMSDSLMKRFRIMVIEFHYLRDLWDTHLFNFAHTVFNKILQTHICVHIHPNNCSPKISSLGIEIQSIAEFTFIRKDQVTTKEFETNFPHKLDCDNDPEKESVYLPKNWYKST